MIEICVKEQIFKTSKNQDEANKTESRLVNFSIEKPKVLYDKNELTVNVNGNLMVDQRITESPKVIKFMLQFEKFEYISLKILTCDSF